MMTNLKSSRCHLAALSLPVMGREEMRRVPRFPGCVADAFRDQLQAVIDSNLFARDDDAASQARDLLDQLRPMPGHEPDPYSSGQDEIDQEVGDVQELASVASDESTRGCKALPLDGADVGGNQTDAGGSAATSLNDVLTAVLPVELYNAMMGNGS